MALTERRVDVMKSFVTINKVPTQVACLGKWLDADGKHPIVLVIPGGPGSIEYYEEFMTELYKGMKENVQVWGVSHAGQVIPPKHLEMPPFRQNKELYSAEAQINHKIAFIQRYVPEGTPLILIGHSIGCHITLEVMKRLPGLNILKTFLLFPAIQQLEDTDEAPRMKRFFSLFLQLPLLILLTFLRLLPEVIQRFLVRIYFGLGFNFSPTPESVISASLNYFNSDCVLASLMFAQNVIGSVKKRDDDTIGKHLDKLIIYYCENDNWCPVKNYYCTKSRFPKGNIILCDKGIPHAFVITKSIEMAVVVKGWIRNLIPGIYVPRY